MKMLIKSKLLGSVVTSFATTLGDLKSLIEFVAIDSTHPNCASSWSNSFGAEVIREKNL